MTIILQFSLSYLFVILSVLTLKKSNISKVGKILFLLVSIIICLINVVYYVADYFTGEGINQAFLYHINIDLLGIRLEEFYQLLISALGYTILSFVLLSVCFKVGLNQQTVKKVLRNMPHATHILFLLISVLINPASSNINKLINLQLRPSNYKFEEYYKIPTLTQGNGKNLIYIYLESFERTYFNNKIFPNVVTNLKMMPRFDFSNIYQLHGTGWTIAGMVSSQCGIPLFTSSSGNSLGGINDFLPSVTCLGDILHRNNYDLTYLAGSSIEFSQIANFYKTHKFNKVIGLENFTENSNIQNIEEKIETWGIRDEFVYEKAYEIFSEKSNSSSPFALFISTIDTHGPKGYTNTKCQKDNIYQEPFNPILNEIKCADYMVSEFLKKVMTSHEYENTIIIVSSDHLAMRNTAEEKLNAISGERRNLFLIFKKDNDDIKEIARPGSTLDISPTVLSFLGIHTDLGLGRNLLNDEEKNITEMDFDSRSLFSEWKEYFHKLWDFGVADSKDTIEIQNGNLYYNEKKYRYPLLLTIDKSNKIDIQFAFEKVNELDEYFMNTDKSDKFLWIDECKKLNIEKRKRFSQDSFCYLYGNISGGPKLKEIRFESNYKIKVADLIEENNNSKSRYGDLRLLYLENFYNDLFRFYQNSEEGDNLYSDFKKKTFLSKFNRSIISKYDYQTKFFTLDNFGNKKDFLESYFNVTKIGEPLNDFLRRNKRSLLVFSVKTELDNDIKDFLIDNFQFDSISFSNYLKSSDTFNFVTYDGELIAFDLSPLGIKPETEDKLTKFGINSVSSGVQSLIIMNNIQHSHNQLGLNIVVKDDFGDVSTYFISSNSSGIQHTNTLYKIIPTHNPFRVFLNQTDFGSNIFISNLPNTDFFKKMITDSNRNPIDRIVLDEDFYVFDNTIDLKLLNRYFDTLLLSSNGVSNNVKLKKKRYSQKSDVLISNDKLIAHAGGSIDGINYTNSLEAVNYNYKKGFRIFELDIIKTSDGVYVAQHDWPGWKNSTDYRGPIPPTHEDFKKYKFLNSYTPIDIDDINDWFSKHDDAVLVTDKINEPIDFSSKFTDRKRLMMELFTYESILDANKVADLRIIFSDNLIFDNDFPEFLEKYNLSIEYAASNIGFINHLKHYPALDYLLNNNVKIFAYGVFKKEMKSLCENSKFIYGIYADDWNFESTNKCN